jgi:hypothetical protein
MPEWMLSVMSPSANPRSVDQKRRSKNWVASREILPEKSFRRMFSLEEKRSERTQRPFALLLMSTREVSNASNVAALLNILSILESSTRETDLMGWHETNVRVGVMFTDIMLDNQLILSGILDRINVTLREKLTVEQFSRIRFSCHLYPEQLRRLKPVSEQNIDLPLSYAVSDTSRLQGPTTR